MLKSIDIFYFLYYTSYIAYRGIEQLAARRAHNPKVGSSSLPPATIKNLALYFIQNAKFLL